MLASLPSGASGVAGRLPKENRAGRTRLRVPLRWVLLGGVTLGSALRVRRFWKYEYWSAWLVSCRPRELSATDVAAGSVCALSNARGALGRRSGLGPGDTAGGGIICVTASSSQDVWAPRVACEGSASIVPTFCAEPTLSKSSVSCEGTNDACASVAGTNQLPTYQHIALFFTAVTERTTPA